MARLNIPVVVLALLLAAGACRAEDKSPIGPVKLQLNDNTVVTGILMDINDESLLLKTKDGEKKYERKKVRKLEPVIGRMDQGEAPAVKQPEPPPAQPAAPAPAKAPEAEEMKIGKAAKPPAPEVVDDIPDEELAPRKAKAKDGENQDNALLARLKGPGRAATPRFEPAANERPSREVAKMPADETRYFERAMANIETRSYRDASMNLRALIEKGTEEDVVKADAASRQKFNRPLAELMTMCYSLNSCIGCRGEGIIKCAACNGTGYLQKNIAGPDGDPKAGLKKTAQPGGRARVAICAGCRGNGYDVCGPCSGTRIQYMDPTPYEREALSQYFMRQAAEALCTGESNYGDTQRENLPTIMPGGDVKLRGVVEQVWLRDSTDRVKSDISRLWRAEGFYKMAMRADPTLPIRYTSKDLTQELNKIGLRRQHLYAELAERSRFQDFHQDE